MNATDSTTFVSCNECTRLFERRESEGWKRRCIDCWKRSKATEKASAPDGYSSGYAAGFAAGSRIAAPAAPELDKSRIRQLLQLCHPDRHAGSALAGEVTAWLLSLRGKQ